MDLSWEARWINLRRELENYNAIFAQLIADSDEGSRREHLKFKHEGLLLGLGLMDEAERSGAPRA